MIRTSSSHPLQIATVSAGEGMGNVGVTFCPGKKDMNAMSGSWDRDLDADIAAIAGWNAAAVVTLMEAHELDHLNVPYLGEATRQGHMEWFLLPIVDVNVPSEGFEQEWRRLGPVLRELLLSGSNLLFHCRGGLGRSGMIAARTLVELGWSSDEAIAAIRRERPGAIETKAQEDVVHHSSPAAIHKPSISEEAVRDRAVGALVGLAVGDALGTTLEFSARDTRPRVDDMVGGGPFKLKPGEWTDDTSMALALAESLATAGAFDPADLMDRFVAWFREGAYSHTGTCFDIGITTRQALNRCENNGDPLAGSIDPMSAGNGSLMRLSPVAIRYWNNPEALAEVAAMQSKTTHAAEEAVDACVGYAQILAEAIAGADKAALLSPRQTNLSPKVAEILDGSWRHRSRAAIKSSGYVVDSMEAALWAVGRTTNFRDAVVLAVNLADDADTVAAITGQLAGAIWGVSSIPREWINQLAWSDHIHEVSRALFDVACYSFEESH